MTLPPVPESFYWTTESWGAALRCRPLEALAPHLFTTRQLTLAHPADDEGLAKAAGAAHVVTLTQVHGATVCVIRRGTPLPDGRPEADVLVSSATDVAIAVRAADCVPLLMADRVTVHAGWRGTAARACVAALTAMQREFGTHPNNIVAAIGPCIRPCCYQVGPDLVDAFAAAGHERYLIDRWFSTPPPPAFAEGFGAAGPGAGRRQLRLDVAGANRDQLILAGVQEANIHMSGLCTAENIPVLTSFRKERHQAGRLTAVIRSH